MGKKIQFDPGAVLDGVISSSNPEDDCYLYKLADFRKSGQLVDKFLNEGSKGLDDFIQKLGPFMYWEGKGELITRTEYMRWKFRNNKQEKIRIDESQMTQFDPLLHWEDHQAVWKMQYRGSLGEALIHILIMGNSLIHTKIARTLIRHFPRCALDIIEGEEYHGLTALHLAIAYGNDELAEVLVQAGAPINQKADGTFFHPKDQQTNKPAKNTNYEGLSYLGEYPLAWAACLCNETVYNLLVEEGADPDAQDTYGNTVLHMVVIVEQLGMFGYALKHPIKKANHLVRNHRELTSLTLSCLLGRDTMFQEMLEMSCVEFWRYFNITCCGYPLGALDSIMSDGSTNWGSAIMLILQGTKEEHLNMLEGGIIAKLLDEKWTTYAKGFFMKRLFILLLHLLTMSMAVYQRPNTKHSLLRGIKSESGEITTEDISRYCFEIATLLGCVGFIIFQLGGEIKNAGFDCFQRNLRSAPPKILFVISCILFLACIPVRILQLWEEEEYYRNIEESMLIFAIPGSWFYLMFFCGAIKLTGPFVTMIFKMVTGDMFTFSIIYCIMLLGFTQAFFFILKSHEEADWFESYHTTWIGLFHMTLGEYEYSMFGESKYAKMAKLTFVIFQILIPILLLNMLIAMMGNTYGIVIESAEKEFLKAWAKVIMSLERSVPESTAKEFLESYSIALGPSERGVMVIKAKDKTRAAQRKGALTNWKKTGRTLIKYLRKRDISGDDLRREFWVHEEASSPKKKKKAGRGYDVKLNQPKVPPVSAAKPSKDPAKAPGALPPIEAPSNGHVANGTAQVAQKVDEMKTPGGGIRRKKSRLERKEALFKKKRARSALNKNVQSIDMGLYPQDSDSSDDDGLFTGTVWWESTDQGDCADVGQQGVDNAAFQADTPARPTPSINIEGEAQP